MNEEKEFQNRIEDLIRISRERYCFTSTDFLSLTEQNLCMKTAREVHFYRYVFTAGPQGEACERKMAVFGDPEDLGYTYEPDICILKIVPRSEKYGELLSHRDYLGAILHLGIERKLIGDIVVKEKTAYVYVKEHIGAFLIKELERIRHTSVLVSKAQGTIPELAPEFLNRVINVNSERLDGIVSAVLGLSRSRTQELIRAKKVFANGAEAESGSGTLKEGDVVSVRGFGKFIYQGIWKETRKGRFFAEVSIYK